MSIEREKFPLTVALRAFDFIRKSIDNSCERIEIAGSCRRGKTRVSEVDMVVMSKTEVVPDGLFKTKTINMVEKVLPFGTTGGPKAFKFTLVAYPDMNVPFDMYLADRDNWGAILAIRTGPADFSKALVCGLLRNGMKQENGYVWRQNTGEKIPVPTEEEYFKLCGFDWIAPEKRQ